jgi:type III pantothenate kinase
MRVATPRSGKAASPRGASLLTVDIGNSETKLGWFARRGKACLAPTRAQHFPTGSRTPGEAVARLLGRGKRRPDGAAMCSVVPAAIRAWRAALRDACEADPLVISGDSDIGIVNHYGEPARLGPDRLVAALAARELYGTPVIIISVGTATVVDAVSRAGEFLGGAIAPGVEASLAALAQRAARLRAVPLERAPCALATNTRAGMIAGAYFGALGQVKELLARARAEMGEQAPAVLTGGHAELVAHDLDGVAGIESALTLVGLRLAWEYRRQRR